MQEYRCPSQIVHYYYYMGNGEGDKRVRVLVSVLGEKRNSQKPPIKKGLKVRGIKIHNTYDE